MEYLCFANGRKKDECIKIFEGEAYEIDRLTSKYIDSDTIREKYAQEFSEFQRKYPNGSKGSVRIYGSSVTNENGWRVLYQKHIVAFKQIIQNERFLRFMAERELKSKRENRIIYDTYVLNGIAYYHKEKVRINQFIASIKREDRKQYGVTGGARRYYRFVRDLLNKYDEYCKHNTNALTIDQIWKQHLEKVQNASVQRKPIMNNPKVKVEPIDDEESIAELLPGFEPDVKSVPKIEQSNDYDPDDEYLGEQPVYREPLYGFFQNDNFERYFSKIFAENEMMVLGDFSVTHDSENLSPWDRIANTCFNGNVTAVDLEHFSYSDFQTFNNSMFITLIGEEDTSRLQTMVIRALENKAQVVLISDDKELLKAYSKKFKSIVPIYNAPDDNYAAQKAYVDFFIEQYQNAIGYTKK